MIADADGGNGGATFGGRRGSGRKRNGRALADRAGRKRVIVLLKGGFAEFPLEKFGKIVGMRRTGREAGKEANGQDQAEACHHSPSDLPAKSHNIRRLIPSRPARSACSSRFRTVRTGSGRTPH